MAKMIEMRHPQHGLKCVAYVGFSWTTLFFGVFPAYLRGDWRGIGYGFVTAVLIAVTFYTVLVPIVLWISWAHDYNRGYTRRLIEQGFVANENHDQLVEEMNRSGWW